MNKPLVLACLASALAACSSIDGRIADLKAEDSELSTRIDRLDSRRKAVERMISALKVVKSEGSRSNEAELARAEANYASTPKE